MTRYWFKKTGIILFWILIWQLLAMVIHKPIVLVGPWEVAKALGRLILTGEFWRSVGYTLGKIACGFILSLIAGVLLGVVGYVSGWFRDFLEPVILLFKSVPVASFVILALIWAGSENLSVLISFLVSFPVIYIHTLGGLQSVDGKLLQMAAVFRMPPRNRIRYIYLPALLPYLADSFRITLGLCWKSGVAAEVIGVPMHSIGEKLYMAKIYLSTDELFAWTFVVIILSAAFEKLCLELIGERTHGNRHRKSK